IISFNYLNKMGDSIVRESREAGNIADSNAKLIANIAVNESKSVLLEQIEEQIQYLAIKEANEDNLFFESIKRESEYLAYSAMKVYADYNCSYSDQIDVMTSVPITNESIKDLFIENANKDLINFYLSNPYYTLNKSEFAQIYKMLKPEVLESINRAKCIAPFFKQVVDNNPYVDWIYIGLNNGVTVLYPYDENPASYDPRVREWYLKAIKENKTIWTDIYVDAGGAGLMITCATPVVSTIGVIGMDITIETLKKQILSINIENGYGFLIESRGKVIARPDLTPNNTKWDESFKTENLLETNNMELKKIVKDMVAGNTGYGICNFEGDEKYIAYAPINSTGWSLGVVIPVSVINKAIGSTKEKIDAASEETSHKINESTKQISENLNKTANRMQNMYLILAVFAVISTSLSALYFGRNIRHYGKKLKNTKDYLDNILENANDIIYVLDKNGNFTFLNKKAEEITGYKREEFIGRPFTELLAPEYVECSINRFKKIIQGDLIESSELEIITKSGKRVYLELNAIPIKENGKIVGVQGIARDITEKKKLE
ncbi:MAG: PAS domain S-box protein, partial [Methanosarcinales archaeon]